MPDSVADKGAYEPSEPGRVQSGEAEQARQGRSVGMKRPAKPCYYRPDCFGIYGTRFLVITHNDTRLVCSQHLARAVLSFDNGVIVQTEPETTPARTPSADKGDGSAT